MKVYDATAGLATGGPIASETQGIPPSRRPETRSPMRHSCVSYLNMKHFCWIWIGVSLPAAAWIVVRGRPRPGGDPSLAGACRRAWETTRAYPTSMSDNI